MGPFERTQMLNPYEKKRMEVWLEAWNVVAARRDVVDIGMPRRWADDCLAAFDYRFGPDRGLAKG